MIQANDLYSKHGVIWGASRPVTVTTPRRLLFEGIFVNLYGRGGAYQGVVDKISPAAYGQLGGWALTTNIPFASSPDESGPNIIGLLRGGGSKGRGFPNVP